MSRLLETACKEAKSGNKDLVYQVRHIGNRFLNAVEISAHCVQFMNTSIPDDRAFLLKPIKAVRHA